MGSFSRFLKCGNVTPAYGEGRCIFMKQVTIRVIVLRSDHPPLPERGEKNKIILRLLRILLIYTIIKSGLLLLFHQ